MRETRTEVAASRYLLRQLTLGLTLAVLVLVSPLAAVSSASGDQLEANGPLAVEVPDPAPLESRNEGYRRGGLRVGFYSYPWFNWGWGGWPYWGGWGGPWVGGGYWDPDSGAVDLNIRPKSAEVFVDGAYVGRVDQFDGFPRYLWLERGSRNVVIYKQGYESLARRIAVRPGQVLDLRERMVAGEAKTPEELFAQLEPEPEVVAADPAPPRPPLAQGSRSGAQEDWRERRPTPPAPSRVQVDQRSAPGRVQIAVTPADASVYLDGRLLGSGEELARLHRGLMVDVGAHELEVVRPGFEGTVERFEIASDEDLRIDVLLQPADR